MHQLFYPAFMMSPIPLPEVFQHTHAWTYGCPHASPSLGSNSIVPPELSDPDVVYVRPPDKIHVFKTPGAMQYIPVPEMPPDPSDPTGTRRMMEFLGFDKEHVDVAVSGTTTANNAGAGNVGAITASTPAAVSTSQPTQTPVSSTSSVGASQFNTAPTPNAVVGPTQPPTSLIRSL